MNMDILVYIGIFCGLYFAVFVLSAFFENRTRIYKKENSVFPRVCLIVPCYNEEKVIEKTLASLLVLDYPRDRLEITAVDDGSTDSTYEMIKSFEKYGVRILKKENGGKHTALNLAIKNSTAPFLGTIDADSYVHPQALKRIMRHFDNPKVMATISTIKISKVRNIIEGVQYVEFLLSAFLKKMYSILGSINAIPGPLSVFRREVFDILGPYKKAYQTEDLEYALRMQKANMKIDSAIDAIIYTVPCPSLKSLFLQRLRWRRGFILNLKDYPDLLNIRRHGNLSFFLFYNVLGSCLTVGLLVYAVYRLLDFIIGKINYYLLVGIDLNLSMNLGSISWRPTLILGIISLATFFIYLFFSRKLTFDSKPIKRDTVSYILLYTFLNAIFWILAIYSAIFKKEVYWK